MTKLCPRGKRQLKENFEFIRQHTLTHMLVRFVPVRLKILLVKKEKILKDLNLQVKLWVVEYLELVVELRKQLEN